MTVNPIPFVIKFQVTDKRVLQALLELMMIIGFRYKLDIKLDVHCFK